MKPYRFIFNLPLLLCTLCTISSITLPAVSATLMEETGHFGGATLYLGQQDDNLFLVQGIRLKILAAQAEKNLNAGDLIASLTLPATILTGTYYQDKIYLSYFDPGYTDSLLIINVKDPEYPFSEGCIQIAEANANITQIMGENGFLYLTTGTEATLQNSLLILDLSGSDKPVVAGSYTIPIISFYVQNQTVYIAEGEQIFSGQRETWLTILDASDGSNITQISRTAVRNLRDIDGDASLTYLTASWDGLTIMDVSDKSAPQISGTYPDPGKTLYSVTAENNRAYVQSDYQTLEILDTTDPANPELLSTFDLGSSFIPLFAENTVLHMNVAGEYWTLDITDPADPEAVPVLDFPAVFVDCAATGNLLIGVDSRNGISIYDCSTPGSPDRISQLELEYAQRVFIQNSRLYAADVGNICQIYDISDPASPAPLGSFDPDMMIYDMGFQQETAYCIGYMNNNTDELKALNINDPAAPQIIGTHQLGGTGKTLLVPESGNTIIAGFIGVDEAPSGLDIIDISQPDNPSLLKRLNLTGSPVDLWISDTDLLVCQNNRNSGLGELGVYNITDPANPELIKTISLSTSSPVADMTVEQSIFIFSLSDEGLIAGTYNPVTKNLTIEARLKLEKPLKTVASSCSGIGKRGPGNLADNEDIHTYTLCGFQEHGDLYAKYGLATGRLQRGLPQFVQLDMRIEPSEAADHGCAVSPAVGIHRYTLGATASLNAQPNENNGWFFHGWSGDAGGQAPNTSVVMNSDKTITGEFVELSLTLTGDNGKTAYFPDDVINRNTSVLGMTFTASEVSGWDLFSVNLRPWGSGDEKEDIEEVKIYLLHEVDFGDPSDDRNLVFSGTYQADDGEMHATFNDPIRIPAGSFVDLVVEYRFDWDPDTYLENSVKTFALRTDGFSARPWDYEEGNTIGQARADTLTIGRVKDRRGHGFYYIQEAIDSESTVGGDWLTCWKGVFQENINITKSVRLQSRDGSEHTVIESRDQTLAISRGSLIGTTLDFVEIYGFEIRNCRTGIFMMPLSTRRLSVHDCRIHACENKGIYVLIPELQVTETVIYNAQYGIYAGCNSGDISQCTIFGNQQGIYRRSLVLPIPGQIFRVRNCDIFNNDSQGIFAEENTLIINNRIYGQESGFGVSIDGDHNNIISNEIYSNGAGIHFLNGSMHNTIYRNNIYNNGHTPNTMANGGIILERDSDQNDIMLNTISANFIGLRLGDNCWNNDIYINRIVNNHRGIICENIDRQNLIAQNTIEGNEGNTGIHLTGSSPTIRYNQISQDLNDGIVCEQKSEPVIKFNNIFENAGFELNNRDGSITVQAQNNWWGTDTGPDAGDISGNVNTTDWLTSPVSLMGAASRDTLYLTAERSDSLYLMFASHQHPEDIIDVTLSGADSWITSPRTSTLSLVDTLGQDMTVYLTIPAAAQAGEQKWLTFTAVSQTDINDTIQDSVLIQVYGPALAGVVIYPDTVFLYYDETVTFSGTGYDQHHQALTFTPVWTAEGGTIDESGQYTAGKNKGTYHVIVSDQTGQFSDTATVIIASAAVQEPGKNPIPGRCCLYPNYPNPFNPVTRIRFDVAEACKVEIRIYDINGREVTILVNGRMPAGRHAVHWNAGNFSAGVYLIHIQMNDYVKTRKMLLIK